MGKRVVYDVHEDMPTVIFTKGWLPRPLRGALSGLTRWVEAFTARRFFSVVTATPFIRDRFRASNPAAIDVNNFPMVAELMVESDWDTKEPAACYVGGIASIRGVVEMVEAIQRVEPPAHLLLAGAFVSRAERDEVMRLPGWARTRELGFLDRAGIREVLQRSRVGLVTLHPVPNYVDALPVKMFEYMCAGIPVVASNFPLWRQIVEGSGCGICVDPLRPQDIADAVGRLLKDPALAREMGERGRQAVKSQYSWEIEEAKLVDLYRSLAQDAGR